jgi:hypothetical protein
MSGRCAILVVLALALPTAAAHAATPVLLGGGNEPGVAVDAAGTAYVAWVGNGADPTPLNFCRLPRGATACDVSGQLAVPGTSLTRPFVSVSGSRVQVFTYRYGLSGPRFSTVLRLRSTDGGASFDAGTEAGTVGFFDAIPGPGDTVSMIADNSSIFQNVPGDGSGQEMREVHLADDHPYAPTVGLIDAATPIAAFANGAGAAQFRRYTGSGTLNDAANWTPAQDFSATASYPRFASGPAGLFLQSDDVNGNMVVQKFDGSTFGAPVPIPGPADELTGGSKDMFQDAAGRLHVVWPFGDASGNHIGYAISDDGTTWRTTRFESGPNPGDVAQNAGLMRLGIAPDHIGVAVWQSGESPKNVYALAVGPDAVAPPVIGKTANAAVVKGKVLVKRKGSKKFVPLGAGGPVPVGSTFDTRKGTVAIDTAGGTGKPLQHGEFKGSQFVLQQSAKNPLTTLSLGGGGLTKCSGRVPKGGSGAQKRRRSLFSNVTGRFRTRGRNSSATVRGTKWTMTDTCAGTLTIVKQGTVVVRDFSLRKNKTLKTGQRYLARPPRLQRRGNR